MISQERDGRTYTYLYDGHGSVVGLMSKDGAVTDTYTYDAFGNLLKSTGRTANNYRYCGEQFDSTTGLYYLRARYMDTSTGRFISQDSYAGSVYDPVSLHKYLYANSNPVMYSDPSGYTAGSLTDTQVAMAGMTIVAAGLIAYNNTVLNIGLSLINALKGIAYEVNALFDDLEALITDLSSGSKTSVDVNAEVREEAVNDATGGAADGADSGGAAPNPDDNGNKNGKNNDFPKYPGDDPNKSPGDDWEWRGKGTPNDGKGNWTNPNTGESLHPDLDHPEPLGPHWDYKDPNGNWFRLFPDGSVVPK